MIDMYFKYDNTHKIKVLNALICINNHTITSINYMLSEFIELIPMDL